MPLWSKMGTYGAFLCLLLAGVLCASAAEDEKAKKAADLDDQSGKVSIAIPLHQPVKGIHLPFYDLKGKLKMQFDATTADRVSENVVNMTELKIETFDEKGVRDMLVQFPTAVYDLASSMISTKESVEVRRTGFVLTGVGMEFDTKRRSGRVFSQIRMEIFNRQSETSPTPHGP